MTKADNIGHRNYMAQTMDHNGMELLVSTVVELAEHACSLQEAYPYLASLLYHAAANHDQELLQTCNVIKMKHAGRPFMMPASAHNLPPRGSVLKSSKEPEKDTLNYFAPSKNLKELLKETWFKEVRTCGKYDDQWTDGLISSLMTTEWKDGIARDWAIKGKRNKRNQIKGHIVGLLADGDVLKGSYDSIAAKVGVTDEPRSFSRYMGEGKNQPYAEWVKNYINEQK